MNKDNTYWLLFKNTLHNTKQQVVLQGKLANYRNVEIFAFQVNVSSKCRNFFILEGWGMDENVMAKKIETLHH